MDIDMLLGRFDGQTRLLLVSLLSGASGVVRALNVFRKQRRSDPQQQPRSLNTLLKTLCQEEICPETQDRQLAVKPLVCLFPVSFKQNLLSFIHLVHSHLLPSSVLPLLVCLSQDPGPDPWVTALVRQVERDLGAPAGKPLHTELCSQRLKELSESLVGTGSAGGWALCLGGQNAASACLSGSGLSDLGTQRKRKSCVTLDSDAEETEQQSKRIKTDFSNPVEGVDGGEGPTAAEPGIREETTGKLSVVSTDASAEELNPAPSTDLCDALDEHIQASVLQIKELLESQTEWDQSSTDVFRVLNECDHAQVEVLCNMLSLPDVPEQTLTKLCSCLLALTPDLSYSTAATLIRSLLLGKVVSLTEPASRCLVTAATSLCSRYARPSCDALIRPLLEEKNIGNPQAELLDRLIVDCLEPQHRLLLLQVTFKLVWSETVLSVIHSLLDSKPELSEEIFTHFTEQLVSQAPRFTKSMKFAKMMLTVLTKYNSHVTVALKHSLSSCLTLNETFLKKSLQAALKRITHA
ncbi:Fanconi anemia group E protein [Diretmus argenteus]